MTRSVEGESVKAQQIQDTVKILGDQYEMQYQAHETGVKMTALKCETS
jgi:hypothetical protein